MNDFTQKMITAALKILEFAMKPSTPAILATALVSLANTLVVYAIAFDPPPSAEAFIKEQTARAVALQQDVNTRIADLGGALSKVSK